MIAATGLPYKEHAARQKWVVQQTQGQWAPQPSLLPAAGRTAPHTFGGGAVGVWRSAAGPGHSCRLLGAVRGLPGLRLPLPPSAVQQRERGQPCAGHKGLQRPRACATGGPCRPCSVLGGYEMKRGGREEGGERERDQQAKSSTVLNSQNTTYCLLSNVCQLSPC